MLMSFHILIFYATFHILYCFRILFYVYSYPCIHSTAAEDQLYSMPYMSGGWGNTVMNEIYVLPSMVPKRLDKFINMNSHSYKKVEFLVLQECQRELIVGSKNRGKSHMHVPYELTTSWGWSYGIPISISSMISRFLVFLIGWMLVLLTKIWNSREGTGLGACNRFR